MSRQAAFESVAHTKDVSAPRSRLAVRLDEAAQLLSMSVDSFDRHVRSEIATIRRGTLVLVPVAELAKWTERNAVCVGSDWS